MGEDTGRDEMASSRLTKVERWLKVLAIITGGLWTVFVLWNDNRIEKERVVLQEKLATQRALFESRINELDRKASERHDQFNALPAAFAFLEKRDCGHDVLAVFLLRQIAAYSSSGQDQAVGGVVGRQALRMIYNHQVVNSKYCFCDDLATLRDFVEHGQGQDADSAEQVARIAEILKQQGKCSGESAIQANLIQKSVAEGEYVVILASDLSCDQSADSMNIGRAALLKAKEAIPSIDPGRVSLRVMRTQGKTWQVTLYAAKLTLADAATLVQQLQQDGVARPDVFWARSEYYQTESQCRLRASPRPIPGREAILPALTGQRRLAVEAALTLYDSNVPFVYGGKTPEAGMDTSGFAAWALARAGLLDHPERYGSAALKARFVTRCSGTGKPGDLLFEENNAIWIVLGENRAIGMIPSGVTVGDPATFSSKIARCSEVPYRD
jgi:hypothetical protein